MGGQNYCSIFGCHKKKKKKNEHVTLFSIPRNPSEREKWSKEIQRTGKPMRLSYKVCELHFTEDDIVRYYETLLPDGTVWRMKKGRCSLKKGAVPTIFPNVPNTLQNGESRNVLNNVDKKLKSKNTYCEKNYESIKVDSDQFLITKYTETFENTQQTDVEPVLSDLTEPFSYSTLVKNLDLLQKPDSLWGISVHDEFVVCAKWNKEGSLMKSVIIDSDLKIKVFFKNKATEMDFVNIENMTGLSTLLKDIDHCGICLNVNDIEKTNCEGYILPASLSNLCNFCRLIGNWEIDGSKLKNFYWLRKGQNFMKLQTLYDKIDALNKDNMLLKEQLRKIVQIKAVWKMPEQANRNSTELKDPIKIIMPKQANRNSTELKYPIKVIR